MQSKSGAGDNGFKSFILIALTMTNLLWAQESPRQAPRAIAHWVGEDGVVETQRGAELQTEWTWIDSDTPNRQSPLDEPDPTIGPATPVLKVYLHTRAIPESWTFTGAHSDNAQLVTMQKADGSDHRLRRLIIYQRAAIANIDLNFNGGGRPRHLKLALTVPAHTPLIYLHRSCKGFEVKPIVKTVPNAAQHLFLGMTCTKDDSDFYFHFLRSADSSWSEPKPELLLKIEKGSKKIHERDPIFTVRTQDLNGHLSEHGLYCLSGSPYCKHWKHWQRPQ